MPNSAKQDVILVVEDNPAVSSAIQSVIQTITPCQVMAASNGAEALQMLACLVLDQPELEPEAETELDSFPNLPALILSDIQMPVMDGIKFAQIIQSSPVYYPIPLILLSAYGVDLPASLKQHTFLPKPFDLAALTQAIQQALATQAA